MYFSVLDNSTYVTPLLSCFLNVKIFCKFIFKNHPFCKEKHNQNLVEIGQLFSCLSKIKTYKKKLNSGIFLLVF
jgi:uncharacterized Fe-S cluster-containing radical SAM superfamily enzyme